jgi:hypothetical protein
MIFAEFLVLVGILTAGGMGMYALYNIAHINSRQDNAKLVRFNKMLADLDNALQKRDYRLLDDWLVVYSDVATESMKKHVSIRRDELYIESP